jgi:D-threo-aldose 1-dehydrogenase
VDPRQRAGLGRTSLTVTRFGLGTAPLGGLFTAVADDEARGVVEAAWAAGVRLFDTAPLYGYGLAERRLGAVLGDRPRDAFTLATKVGRLLRAGAPPDPGQNFRGVPPVNPVFDFSYDGALRSVTESLERLGLDRVDVVHIHDPDDHFDEALQGAYPALDRLRREGMIGAVGAGMNQAEMLARFAREADFDCFLLAGRYTLLDQVALRELLPLCLDRGIAVMAGGVLNSGILADPRPGATYDYARAGQEVLSRARRLDDICRSHGVPLKAAAIQFPLGHPAITSVLLGCRSRAELAENVRMAEIEVPAALWEELKAEGMLAEEVPTPSP